MIEMRGPDSWYVIGIELAWYLWFYPRLIFAFPNSAVGVHFWNETIYQPFTSR